MEEEANNQNGEALMNGGDFPPNHAGLRRLRRWLGLSLFVVLAASGLVWQIFASPTTNRSDLMSNQSASATSSHTISFNLTGSNTFAAGEVIAVDFPSGFTQGGTWATADFSFTDGTARTIAGVNAGAGVSTVSCTNGTNNVGVAVDTTDLVFRVIPCGGSFTASPAGAYITFVINGNSADGTLTNPVAIGSYVIDVIDAAGDCTAVTDDCSVSVTVVTDSSISVTAWVKGCGDGVITGVEECDDGNTVAGDGCSATCTLEAVCGNGSVESGETCDDGNTVAGDGCSATCQTEGGGGGPTDPGPPIISNIQVSSITTSGATVTWDTDQGSTTLIRYGLTASYGSTSSDPGLVYNHTRVLSSLSQGATYHYQVCSTNSFGTQGCSSDQTFTTLDETPPVISNVQVTTGTTSAVITWDTNENASSYVDWGLTAGPPYTSTNGTATLVTSHSVTISSLSEATTYHFRVRSGDASSNESFTVDATFLTASSQPPVISNVQVKSITDTSAVITWSTNRSSTTYVDYGTSTGVYPSSQGTSTPLVTFHSATLSGLTAGTQYFFRVRSADQWGNQATSGEQTFTTTESVPPVISGINITNLTPISATVNWTTDENSTSVVEYGTSPSLGSTASVAGLTSPSHAVPLSGLTPGSTVYYRVKSADVWGNTATSSVSSFVVPIPAPPVISGINISNLTSTSATVNWTTDISSTSVVEYGTSPSLGSTASVAGLTSPSHAVPLSGLTPGSTVYYRVKSVGQYGNTATSSVSSFVVPFPAPPVISNIVATNNSPTSTTITWTTDISSTSKIEYGLTVTYGASVANSSMVTAHSITLNGLTPNTLYNYRVTSADQYGQSTTTANRTFTSQALPALIISNIQVTNITESGARITWDTSNTSSTKAEWGLTTSYGTQWTSATLTTSHLAVPTGLTQGTLYHYKITATDNYGQTAFSSDRTFTTVADTAAPANPTNFTATPGDQYVVLSWVNPTDADFQGVKIMRKTTGFPTGPTDGTQVYTGMNTTYTDTGRTNGVQYYYAIYAYDEVPNYSSGAVASATPVGALDVTAPANITNFQATPSNQQITLTWINPTDADFQGTLIVRKSLTCPTSRTDGTVIYDGSDSTKVDTGLSNGTFYCYRAFAHDPVPNYASGVNASATPIEPPDTSAPGPVTNFQASPGDGQVLLTWNNPSDSDWVGTRLVRKTGSAPTSPTDGTIVFDGMADNYLDTGVSNGVTYYYSAFTYDSKPNYSGPVSVSATPEAGADVGAVACSDSDGGLNYQVRGTVTLQSGDTFEDVCFESKIREYFCEGDTANNTLYECPAGYKCSSATCIPDVQEPVTVVCGNGICEGYENSLNCLSDCPITPEAPPVEVKPDTVTQDVKMGVEDLVFYATRGRIRLRVSESILQVYNNMTFTVKIPEQSIQKPIESAYVNYGNSSYIMKQTGSYEAQVVSAAQSGDNPLTVVVTYDDGESDSIGVTVRNVSRPVVSGQVDDQDGQPLKGVRVTLFKESSGSFGVYDLSQFNQLNPQVTDDNGKYGFVLPEGTYRLRFDKEEYSSREGLSFKLTTENVVTRSVALRKLPPPPVEEIVKVITSEGTVVEKATKIVGTVTDQASYVAEVAAENVIDAVSNQIVQDQTQAVVAPTATAVTVVNVVTVASVIPYLNFVISLLAHPLMLIARRRRKQWGVVYNSLNKMPVDLAIVRLTDAKTGRIVRSAVTDKDGRFFFIVDEGEYRVNAVKAGFVFPSEYLKTTKDDAQYTDLYHGEVIKAKKNDAIIVNIPLDPYEEKAKSPWRVTLDGILRRFQRALGILAIVGMAVISVMNPSVFTIGLLVANIFFYLVFTRLAMPKRPKNWGVVYDDKSRKPLSNVVVRIFESRFNKLLETQVTDIRGRYAFLVGNNVYYVTYEKPGYQKQQKGPVDYAVDADKKEKRTEANVVAVDIRLKKEGGESVADDQKTEKPAPEKLPIGQQPVIMPSALQTPAPKPEAAESVAETEAKPEPAAPAETTAPSETVEPKKHEARGMWELEMIKKMQAGAVTPPDAQSSVSEQSASDKPIHESPKTENTHNRGLWELEMIKKMAGSGSGQNAVETPKQDNAGDAVEKPEASPMEGSSVTNGPLLEPPKTDDTDQEKKDI